MTIEYKYNNMGFTFFNVIKNYTLSNSNVKGLEAYFFFEVNSSGKHNCTPDNITYNKDFGGMQEIYSLTSMRETLLHALDQGLLDVKPDRRWEVSAFQFYMGDLIRAVPEAKKYPPEDRFNVSCKWDKIRESVSLKQYGLHQIYVTAGEICTLSYQNKDII